MNNILSSSFASLTLYQSSVLETYTERLIHGFTGKPVSFGGEANSQDIEVNREKLCQTLGFSVETLVIPDQIHSDHVRFYDDIASKQENIGTDAVILTKPGHFSWVQTADCVPIIAYDAKQHIGAVVHAGWRGTAQQISVKTIVKMMESCGSRPEGITVAIGPSARVCCYEVSEEVMVAVSATVKADKTVYQHINTDGKPQVDLQQLNKLQLQALGVKNIEVLPVCTICSPESLWSYRRGETGRQVAFLALK